MYTRRFLVSAFLFAALLPAQESVQVTGNVQQTLNLTTGDLAKMPRASVRTTSNGKETVYEGVWLNDILKQAGTPQGKELRGKLLAGYVLAEAQDGYQVVFSRGEIDPAFADSQILLADTADGKPLSAAQGRFRLVAPKDKAGARSIRKLTKLELVQLSK